MRRAVALEQERELVGDARRPPAAEGLIGQGDRQLLAVRVVHHARELARLGVLVGRLLRARVAQQRLGERPRRGELDLREGSWQTGVAWRLGKISKP